MDEKADQSPQFSTEYTGCPVCPWCGYEDYEWWDGAQNNAFQSDGDSEDQECQSCEKPYLTSISISHDFTTTKRNIEAEKEQAEAQRARTEEQRLKRLAGVETFPPGTRVKVVQKKYSDKRNGLTGVVANEEINRRNPYVHVNLDDEKFKRSAIFDPDEIERLEA